MFIPAIICENHHLEFFFTNTILLYMSRILKASSDFDIEQLETYLKNPTNQELDYHKIAVELSNNNINTADIKLIAKKQDITRKNLLTILKQKNPDLNEETFTADCKTLLAENPDPLFQKLLEDQSKN